MRNLADFLGSYSVSRVIDDHASGAQSTFDGRAQIVRYGDGAKYTEEGALTHAGQSFAAERTYLWQPQGARISVLFGDGRAFHDFDPALGGQATEHLCGADLYRGGYDFAEWSCWSVRWDVTGPRKDYTSVTWYVREYGQG